LVQKSRESERSKTNHSQTRKSKGAPKGKAEDSIAPFPSALTTRFDALHPAFQFLLTHRPSIENKDVQCLNEHLLELSVELGFGFYWVSVPFFFSSGSLEPS
jgi:hypothetical protein